MSTPDDDAQRRLEQHALRNVRGLVDKMAASEESDRRALRSSLRWIAAVVAVLAGVIAVFVVSRSQPPSASTEIVVPPPARR